MDLGMWAELDMEETWYRRLVEEAEGSIVRIAALLETQDAPEWRRKRVALAISNRLLRRRMGCERAEAAKSVIDEADGTRRRIEQQLSRKTQTVQPYARAYIEALQLLTQAEEQEQRVLGSENYRRAGYSQRENVRGLLELRRLRRRIGVIRTSLALRRLQKEPKTRL